MAGAELAGIADIEAIERGRVPFGDEAGERRRIDGRNGVAVGQPAGRFPRPVLRRPGRKRGHPRGATLHLKAGEVPALGAVLQRHHGVGQPRVDQDLSADDRTGTSAAIDHDKRIVRRHALAHAQHKLAARAVDRAGNGDPAVFVKGAAIEQHDVVAGLAAGLELMRVDMRGFVGDFDHLAKGLARHIDPGEQLETGCLPGGNAAGEDGDVGIAAAGQHLRGACRQRLVLIDQHHRGRAAGHQRRHQPFETAQRRVRGGEQMALGEDAFLAHIKKGDLGARGQPCMEGGGVDARKGGGHASR